MPNTTKHLTVFGATGGTGVHFIQAALAGGYTVTAVARDPSRVPITHQRLSTVRGDVLDRPSLTGSLDSADAVVSALGAGNGRKPTTVYSTGVTNILDLMSSAGVHRFVGISALPVTPRDQVGACSGSSSSLCCTGSSAAAMPTWHAWSNCCSKAPQTGPSCGRHD